MAVVALVIVGVAPVVEKTFGPDHEYVVPVPVAVRVMLLPTQTGELLLAVTLGVVLTTALTEAVPVQDPFATVTI